MIKRGLMIALAALIAATPTRLEAADFPALFETVAFENDSLDALPQWRRVLEEIAAEKPVYQACAQAPGSCSPRALLAWRAMITAQSGQSPTAQLRAVNRFVNQWRPEPDISNYQQDDFWSSPLTFLRRSGDCEDYAIMKYVSLREVGFAAEQIRIVVVRDLLRDLPHAVLAVHIDEEIYILDNLFQAVLPQRRVRQYLPYYSVNERARWSHLPPDRLLLSTSPWTIMPSADSPSPPLQPALTPPRSRPRGAATSSIGYGEVMGYDEAF
jgi:predicted transglutaminase-like cysteine proteinase